MHPAPPPALLPQILIAPAKLSHSKYLGPKPQRSSELPWSVRHSITHCKSYAFPSPSNAIWSPTPPSLFLFAYLDDQGTPQHTVKSVFLTFCDRIRKFAGLEHVHSHSFRIGGAVELLLAGVTPEVVALLSYSGADSMIFYPLTFSKRIILLDIQTQTYSR
ncbi:hypothetical protein BT96DRAFT_1050191 [Gymnopus androsaceus JB14]|uniref:Uncharacterized protein n=1 Tax=Gymnopus androsaceus JB14 TaxID=1447944 RepID=A0A6A4H6F6_9AGAR|nr:hypothetical protein BT96DRAFT_1050191 [Gymnopus androsaceus JB14]